MQPAKGFAERLPFNPMNGQTKRRKTPGEMREVLAQNINRLMESRYRESTNRPMALAKDAGVTLSTVQRTLSRETGASIDTLESFAKVFGLAAYQLLMPTWMVGASPPPNHRRREIRRPERSLVPAKRQRRTVR